MAETIPDPAPETPPHQSDSSIVRRLARAAGALTGRYIAMGVISLAGSTILLRSLTPREWVSYGLAYFVVVVTEHALTTRVLGEGLRGERNPSSETLRAAIGFSLLVGAGVSVLTLTAAFAAERATGLVGITTMGVGAAVATMIVPLRSVPILLLERQLAYGRIALAELVDHATFYLLALTLLAAGAGLTGVAVALAVRTVGGTALLRRKVRAPLRPSFGRARMKSIIGDARPAVQMGLIAAVEGLIPAILLAHGHPDDLAYLVMAATVMGYAAIPQFLAQRLSFSGLSAMVRDQGRDLDNIHTATRFALQANAGLLAILITPVAGMAPAWIPLVIGETWEQGAAVMIPVGLAYLFAGPTHVLVGAALTETRAHDVARAHAEGLCIFIISAAVLLAPIPTLGVAVGWAISKAYVFLRLARDETKRLRSPVLALAGGACAISVSLSEATASDSHLIVVALLGASGVIAAAVMHSQRETLRGIRRGVAPAGTD